MGCHYYTTGIDGKQQKTLFSNTVVYNNSCKISYICLQADLNNAIMNESIAISRGKRI